VSDQRTHISRSPAHPLDERLYRMLVEQALDYALFLLDPNGNIISWNRGAERIKGYRAEEIIGLPFTVFYTPEALERNWPARELELAALHGHFEDEGWRVKKDGSRFWANVVISALHDPAGRLLGYSKITRDLTERRRAEEALRESEERFRLLVEGVTDYAIYMLSPEGLITSWNSGATNIMGFAQDEVINTHFSRFYVEHERTMKPAEELETARRVGRMENEGWRVTKDGRRFWARVVVTSLYGIDGALRGYTKITQDLTEHQHVQALEKSAKRVSEFISVLAHELRNPLAPIRNAVELFERLPPDSPTIQELHRIVDRQSAQLVRIVDDMLDMSRIAKGMVSVHRVPVDLAEPVRRAIETVSPLLTSRDHKLEVVHAGQPIHVAGDLNRLTQLLTNLLSNAARYTPPGGFISVRSEIDKDEAVVTVTDNGRGIAPDAIESMFEMFVRERSVRSHADGGIGIGLALARKIAELHGGTLTGRSEGEGKGSQFTLRLPALFGVVAAAEAPPQTPHVEDTDLRVMVVDDNADAAWALAETLGSLGYQTRVFTSAREALAAVDAFGPSAILLDLGMPGMNGLEMAAGLRARGRGEILLVAVTGWGQAEDRDKTRRAGFDRHLVKPVQLEDLTAVLDQARSRRRSEETS
jgi:PAS domain S-box-containing protein